jgi:spore coat protein U-like protein
MGNHNRHKYSRSNRLWRDSNLYDLAVTCTASTNYQVGLDNGQNGTGPIARQMAFGANRLTYGLYSDSGYTVPWGNTSGSMVAGTGTGNTTNFSVYGTVFTQALPVPGTYTDTVVATVTY